MSHTPLPWSISYGFDARPLGETREPAKYVARAERDFAGIKLATPWIEGAWDDDAEAAANAEFIVRACNSHYEMLQLLRDCEESFIADNTYALLRVAISQLLEKVEGVTA